MKLPYYKNIIIPREKLTKYLLSETHPVGSSKAKFFRSLGFDEANVNNLTKSLSKIAHFNKAADIKKLIYGVNYVVNGTIKAPSGRVIKITTVWFVQTGQKKPRFVTAYPV